MHTIDDSTGEYLTLDALPRTHGGRVLIAATGTEGDRIVSPETGRGHPQFIGGPLGGAGAFGRIVDFWVQANGEMLVLGNRLTHLDADFRPIGHLDDARLGSATHVIGLRNGGAVVNRRAPGVAPLLLLDDKLRIRAELGTAAMHPDSNAYVMATNHAGGFWTARAKYRYELSLYDERGTLIRSLQPSREWFTPWPEADAKTSEPTRQRALPRITAIHEVEPGKLLVIALRPDLMSSSASGGAQGTLPTPTSASLSNRYDTMVEIIDAQTGAPLTKRRFDAVLGGFTGDGLLWHLSDHGPVRRLRLLRPRW